MTDDRITNCGLGASVGTEHLSFEICHLSFRGAESDAIDEPVGRLQVLN